jgi:hypothetical protein
MKKQLDTQPKNLHVKTEQVRVLTQTELAAVAGGELKSHKVSSGVC